MVWILNSLALVNGRIGSEKALECLRNKDTTLNMLRDLNSKYDSVATTLKSQHDCATLNSTPVSASNDTQDSRLSKKLNSLNAEFQQNWVQMKAHFATPLIVAEPTQNPLAAKCNDLNARYIAQAEHKERLSPGRKLRAVPVTPVHRRRHVNIISALNDTFSANVKQARHSQRVLLSEPARTSHTDSLAVAIAALNSEFVSVSKTIKASSSTLVSTATKPSSPLQSVLARLNTQFAKTLCRAHGVPLLSSPTSASPPVSALVTSLDMLNTDFASLSSTAPMVGAVPLQGALPDGPVVNLKHLSEMNDRYAAVALQARIRGETELLREKKPETGLALIDMGLMTDLEQLAPHFNFKAFQPLPASLPVKFSNLLEEPVMRALVLMDKIGHVSNIQRLEAKSLTSPARQLKRPDINAADMLSAFSLDALDEDVSRDINMTSGSDSAAEFHQQPAADLDSTVSSRTKLLLQAYKRAPQRVVLQC